MGSIKFCVVLLLTLTVFCSLSGRTNADNCLDILQKQFPVLYSYVMDYPQLAGELRNPSQTYTVFAPIDAAFNGSYIPLNTTNPPIFYHVARGIYNPASLLAYGAAIPTLLKPYPLANHSQVLITGRDAKGATTLDGVTVLNSITATNGLVYTMQGLLIPSSQYVEELIIKFPTLLRLVDLSGIDLALHPLTLFAPTDFAFSELPAALISYLLLNNSMSRPDLTNILAYHAVGGNPVYTANVRNGQSVNVQTLASESVTIYKPTSYPNSTVMVNGNNIDLPNVLALNGVLHGINGVLVPSDFQFTLEKILYGLGATSFLQQVKNAGLSSLLSVNASRTVLAPTNAAIGGSTLSRDVILYHIVMGAYNQSALLDQYLASSYLTLHSLGGMSQVLKFQNIAVINSSDVIPTVNGVPFMNGTGTINTQSMSYAYLVEQVLSLPINITTLLTNDNFSTLATAVNAINLPWIGNDSLTVFAPTNAAFAALAPGVLGYLLNNNYSGEDTLTNILFGHILDDVYYTKDIPFGTHSFATIEYRTSVTITKTADNNITVNDARVILPDVLAANGVIHGIDRVLLPASFSVSIVNVLEGLGNFKQLLNFLDETNLLSTINSSAVSIFAPNDDAFDEVDDLDALTSNKTRLREVLLAHVVAKNITSLSSNETLPTQIPGLTIVVLEDDEVELRNDKGETQGSSADVTITTYGRNGYAFGINRVLGVEQASHSGSGLKKWQLILIVVGSVVGGLLLLVLVIAVLYFIYHVFYKNKSGYRKIND